MPKVDGIWNKLHNLFTIYVKLIEEVWVLCTFLFKLFSDLALWDKSRSAVDEIGNMDIFPNICAKIAKQWLFHFLLYLKYINTNFLDVKIRFNVSPYENNRHDGQNILIFSLKSTKCFETLIQTKQSRIIQLSIFNKSFWNFYFFKIHFLFYFFAIKMKKKIKDLHSDCFLKT